MTLSLDNKPVPEWRRTDLAHQFRQMAKCYEECASMIESGCTDLEIARRLKKEVDLAGISCTEGAIFLDSMSREDQK